VERARIAREVRRRHVLQAIEDEHAREQALAARLEETVAEVDGPAVDRQVYATMTPADVALVREALDGAAAAAEDEPFLDLGPQEDLGLEDEIVRLQAELARCRARARALVRYLAALDLLTEPGDGTESGATAG
jgi:hypothetical protein